MGGGKLQLISGTGSKKKLYLRSSKAKRSSRTTANLVNNTSGFPRRTMVKLVYHETYLSGSIATGSDDRLYDLNSIYDPNRSGTGHQPMGRDQWATMYNRYRVHSAKVEVTFNYMHGSGLQATIIGTNDTASIAPYDAAAEQPMSVSGSNTGYGNRIKLKKTFNLPRLNGQTKQQYIADDRFQAQMGSNPSELLCLHIVTAPGDGVSTYVYSYSVKIVYTVEFFDGITLAQS